MYLYRKKCGCGRIVGFVGLVKKIFWLCLWDGSKREGKD